MLTIDESLSELVWREEPRCCQGAERMAAVHKHGDSTMDIRNGYAPGERWSGEVAQQLEAADVGIVCVTRDNQSAPWLNFEAGALAKKLESSRVIPLPINLKPSEVQQPLGQCQAIEST